MSHHQAPDPWAHLKPRPRRRKLVLDFGEVEAPVHIGRVLAAVTQKLVKDPGALAALLPEEDDLR